MHFNRLSLPVIPFYILVKVVIKPQTESFCLADNVLLSSTVKLGSTKSDEAAVADDTETALAIHFPIGKWEVLPDYENNHIALDHLVSVLDKIAGAKDSRIARILVVGAASPDGSAKQNEYLAGKRAQALTDYITSHTALSPSLFEISNIGVAWNALRALVADSDMAGRQQVLNIIDTVPVWDATRNTGRLGLIMQLNQGKTYEYMKRHFFPKLRTAGYIKVVYEAQP